MNENELRTLMLDRDCWKARIHDEKWTGARRRVGLERRCFFNKLDIKAVFCENINSRSIYYC